MTPGPTYITLTRFICAGVTRDSGEMGGNAGADDPTNLRTSHELSERLITLGEGDLCRDSGSGGSRIRKQPFSKFNIKYIICNI